ncbi:beta-glucosidase BoGH3B-like [Macadamia integrifolia]|uniref:beta-glucosidase BoGH3B-like n=1 Tax=Macadamia integrifolia TaxID=60698 RepID=UPI001C4E85FB|nr:beta-glucosidase BoGH3B-like [Macadamia integrifolia]
MAHVGSKLAEHIIKKRSKTIGKVQSSTRGFQTSEIPRDIFIDDLRLQEDMKTTKIQRSRSSCNHGDRHCSSLLICFFPFLVLFFFFFFFPSVSAETIQAPYLDPNLSIEERVSDLLSRMTTQEKIGQMAQIDHTVASSEVLINHSIGSVLNSGVTAPSPDMTPAMWADMIDGYQKAALSTRLGIPILYGVDAVHGHNNLFGSTVFPHNIGLGAARDEGLMVRIGRATALEVLATGIPYTFAPSVAVCRDPRWGRCYESYSEDTQIVRSMAKIILGLQGLPSPNHTLGYPFVAFGGRNVLACAKHYAGDGGTQGGVDEYNTVTTYDDLYRIHMTPYIDAITMGVSTVMASYSSWNGVKMHANPFLLTRILKQEMSFQGMVISDWEAIDRITNPPGSHYKENLKAAINAGIDMVMIPFKYPQFLTNMTELVLSGEIPISRIDDAVRRSLRVKFAAGLFERPMADRSLLPIVGHKRHRKLAREAVRKSLVLLKNGKGNDKMLPLDKNAPKIMVAGSHARDMGNQCGGWTITWQGTSGNITKGTTILEGIKKAVSKRTRVVFHEKPDKHFVDENRDSSYAIVVVGEAPYAETSGDGNDLRLAFDGEETIKTVCSKVKCLVIILSGRPVVIEPYVDMMEALVAAWLPGSEAGKGIADVVFGDYDFQGRLPRTWFRRVDQLPMNFGDQHYDPLYPFGYGLQMGIQSVKRGNSVSSSVASSFPSI